MRRVSESVLIPSLWLGLFLFSAVNLLSAGFSYSVASQESQDVKIERLERDSEKLYNVGIKNRDSISRLEASVSKIESQNDILLKLVFATLSGLGSGTLFTNHQIRKIRREFIELHSGGRKAAKSGS